MRGFILRNILITIIIPMLMLSLVYLSRHSDGTITSDSTDGTSRMDGFMEGVTAIRMSALGLPASTLYADKVTHYSQNNTTYLTHPHFVLLAKKGSPWNIDAKNGMSERGIDKLFLWDDVKVHQAFSELNQESTLLTSTLTIFPKTNTATTDQEVTIMQQGSVTKAKGLKIDFNSSRIELLSQSRGIYERNSF